MALNHIIISKQSCGKELKKVNKLQKASISRSEAGKWSRITKIINQNTERSRCEDFMEFGGVSAEKIAILCEAGKTTIFTSPFFTKCGNFSPERGLYLCWDPVRTAGANPEGKKKSIQPGITNLLGE